MLSRRAANLIRGLLDTWLPAAIREARPFAWVVSLWLGRNALVDFKYRAFRMSPQEFAAAYGALGGHYTDRASDTTPAQADWVFANIGPAPLTLLEIGPGNGAMTARLRTAGHDVWAIDLHPSQADRQYLQGTVDSIPLPAKSVDVIVLAHVIEHVPSLTKAFLELERVARRRVLIVTPKQRFFRWTFDYHLHFFYSVDHLAEPSQLGISKAEMRFIFNKGTAKVSTTF